MVHILSGEAIARRILNSLKKKTRKKLSLAVVQVGENKVSLKYVAEAAFWGANGLIRFPVSKGRRV